MHFAIITALSVGILIIYVQKYQKVPNIYLKFKYIIFQIKMSIVICLLPT